MPEAASGGNDPPIPVYRTCSGGEVHRGDEPSSYEVLFTNLTNHDTCTRKPEVSGGLTDGGSTMPFWMGRRSGAPGKGALAVTLLRGKLPREADNGGMQRTAAVAGGSERVDTRPSSRVGRDQ